MDRSSALPDRCVACNGPAASYRISRKLYCSPLAWKIGAFSAPFVAMFLGIILDIDFLLMAFWPLVIALVIAHAFVRKSFKLQLGLCPWHRRQRHLLTAFSFVGVMGVVAGIFTIFSTFGALLLVASTLVVLALAVAQSFVGATSVGLKELEEHYAWLTGTGAPFRAALPELD